MGLCAFVYWYIKGPQNPPSMWPIEFRFFTDVGEDNDWNTILLKAIELPGEF